MKFFECILLLIFAVNISFAEGQNHKVIQLEGKKKNSAFSYPSLELQGRIAEIFTFYDAEYISGLTCKIKYNGKTPLPSKVFFSEYDIREKGISHKVRLIYPELNSGESGVATFRIKGTPPKIVIWSEGEGPWESPY